MLKKTRFLFLFFLFSFGYFCLKANGYAYKWDLYYGNTYSDVGFSALLFFSLIGCVKNIVWKCLKLVINIFLIFLFSLHLSFIFLTQPSSKDYVIDVPNSTSSLSVNYYDGGAFHSSQFANISILENYNFLMKKKHVLLTFYNTKNIEVCFIRADSSVGVWQNDFSGNIRFQSYQLNQRGFNLKESDSVEKNAKCMR